MRSRILSGLLVIAISLVAGLLTLEIGLRVLGIGSDTLMQPDPWAGWVHIPGRRASVRSEDPALGRQLTVTIDSLGLRDIERRVERPPGVYRILVLGDSFIEGQQVPGDSTITRQLERILNASGAGRFEVWNGGVAGYDTGQELLYLRHTAARFRPDLIVLAFLSGNDLADAVPELATSLRNRPFFLESGDTLRLDRSTFRDDPPGVGWLRTHSRTFTWASTQRQMIRRLQNRRESGQSTGGAVPGDFQIYLPRPDSLWALAWRLDDRLILETRDESRRLGADFLLMAISSGVQEAEQAREGWAGWNTWRVRAPLDLDAPERHLAGLCASNDVSYLPLLPAFRKAVAADGRPRHILWSGHWNSAGHALAARVLGDWVLDHRAAARDSAGAPNGAAPSHPDRP